MIIIFLNGGFPRKFKITRDGAVYKTENANKRHFSGYEKLNSWMNETKCLVLDIAKMDDALMSIVYACIKLNTGFYIITMIIGSLATL